MKAESATDVQAETLYWLIVSLDAFGQALLRNDPQLDRWAHFHNTECKVFGPRYDPAGWWSADHGQIGPAERQAFSRAAKSLETLGLVTLIRRHGSRLSHVRPTPKGLAVGLRLAPEASRAAIRAAIQTAEWGTSDHLDALDQAAKARKAKRHQ